MIKKLIKTLILVAILVGLGFLGYNAIMTHQININRFFVGGLTKGVDVSSYQGDVDFSVLKSQGIEFVYVKATEGSAHVDEKFVSNWAAAKTAEMPTGAYHFFSYESSGSAQAENFIKTVGELDAARLIPAVDMELTKEQKADPPEKSAVVTALKAYVATLEEKYGVKPLIYATKDCYEKYLKDDFQDYPRWVRSALWPVYIEAGDDWLVWQYDDHGKLEGYNGPEEFIDLNVINGDKGLELLRWHSL